MEKNIREIKDSFPELPEGKKALRKQMQALRKALTSEEMAAAEQRSIEQLRQTALYQNHTWIYLYVSYQKEMPTIHLIEAMLQDGKRIAVPKVIGEEMICYEITSLSDCEPGCMGILEPKEGLPVAEESGLMLLPGLAFDLTGGRMGYGGGFYDKYLAKHPDLTTVAWIYDFQIVPHVPMEAHDRRVLHLLTPDRGLVRCQMPKESW